MNNYNNPREHVNNQKSDKFDVSLGNTTISASLKERRSKRYDLQRVSGELLPNERVAWCMKKAVTTVSIKRHGERCYYHGLMKCGSIWVCPVCACAISEHRREELDQASKTCNFTMVLVTLTLQHDREDTPGQKIDELSKALRKMRSGKGWKKIEKLYGLVANCSGLEITFSREFGYHPHKHILFFSNIRENEFDLQGFREVITSKWLHCLEAFGAYGSFYHAVDVTIGKREAAGYIAKWGVKEEMTRVRTKVGKDNHYSMWQVLRLAEQGVDWAKKAFVDYAVATKGKRWLVWSKGARELLGLDQELSDEDVVKLESKDDEVVCTISNDMWKLVVKHDFRVVLLEAAEIGGVEAVKQVLELIYLAEKKGIT